MGKWFSFPIPLMPDGKKVTYSQGAWFGTADYVGDMVPVTVHAYNDAEGVGIAYAEGLGIAPEFTPMDEAEALATLSKWAEEAAKVVVEDDRDPVAIAKLPPDKLTADGRIAQCWIGPDLTNRATILKSRDDARTAKLEAEAAFKAALEESILTKPLGVK
jgi:hypothetical protein